MPQNEIGKNGNQLINCHRHKSFRVKNWMLSVKLPQHRLINFNPNQSISHSFSFVAHSSHINQPEFLYVFLYRFYSIELLYWAWIQICSVNKFQTIIIEWEFYLRKLKLYICSDALNFCLQSTFIVCNILFQSNKKTIN